MLCPPPSHIDILTIIIMGWVAATGIGFGPQIKISRLIKDYSFLLRQELFTPLCPIIAYPFFSFSDFEHLCQYT